jgi:hypothetical protein
MTAIPLKLNIPLKQSPKLEYQELKAIILLYFSKWGMKSKGLHLN